MRLRPSLSSTPAASGGTLRLKAPTYTGAGSRLPAPLCQSPSYRGRQPQKYIAEGGLRKGKSAWDTRSLAWADRRAHIRAGGVAVDTHQGHGRTEALPDGRSG
mgnify:CR=1 FL=1